MDYVTKPTAYMGLSDPRVMYGMGSTSVPAVLKASEREHKGPGNTTEADSSSAPWWPREGEGTREVMQNLVQGGCGTCYLIGGLAVQIAQKAAW